MKFYILQILFLSIVITGCGDKTSISFIELNSQAEKINQAPTKYVEATGWRKIVGNVMLFGILFYMARQIWKSWRDK